MTARPDAFVSLSTGRNLHRSRGLFKHTCSRWLPSSARQRRRLSAHLGSMCITHVHLRFVVVVVTVIVVGLIISKLPETHRNQVTALSKTFYPRQPSWQACHSTVRTRVQSGRRRGRREGVDDAISSEDILDQGAAHAFLCLSLRTSQHELPLGISVMAQLMPCINGATTDYISWHTQPSPMLPVFDVDLPTNTTENWIRHWAHHRRHTRRARTQRSPGGGSFDQRPRCRS